MLVFFHIEQMATQMRRVSLGLPEVARNFKFLHQNHFKVRHSLHTSFLTWRPSSDQLDKASPLL